MICQVQLHKIQWTMFDFDNINNTIYFDYLLVIIIN